MSVGHRIKEARERKRITQEELGEMCGTTKQTIFKYENGVVTNIPFDRFERIAECLDVSPAYLMGWEEEKKTTELPPGLLPIPETYKVPRLGSIACGEPILAEQNIETYDSVPVAIRCDFTLICRGDSMIGTGIEDGDIVYIREQPEVETGEIAAVMVGEDEATLKRFKRVGDTVLLIPENSSYEPLIFTGGEMNGIRILGKAVGFTRYFRE